MIHAEDFLLVKVLLQACAHVLAWGWNTTGAIRKMLDISGRTELPMLDVSLLLSCFRSLAITRVDVNAFSASDIVPHAKIQGSRKAAWHKSRSLGCAREGEGIQHVVQPQLFAFTFIGRPLLATGDWNTAKSHSDPLVASRCRRIVPGHTMPQVKARKAEEEV